MSSTAPAQNIVTADNFGPAVNILNWFLTVTTVLAVTARVLTKLNYLRFGSDDIAILLALVFSIGLCVAASYQELNGLGQHQYSLSPDELGNYQKAAYAVDILSISTLLFSKWSVVIFLHKITPVESYRRLNLGLGLCMGAWGFSGILAAAFQCSFPRPWTVLGDRCFDQDAFKNYIAVSNILLELPLIVLPISIFGRIQASLSRKTVILGCFAARVMVVAAIIVQLVYSNAQTGSDDRTFDGWQTAIASLFVETLSIITASIPGLKPFLRGLETGMIRSDDIQRRGTQLLAYPDSNAVTGIDDSKGIGSGRLFRLQKLKVFPLHGGRNKNCDTESQSSQSKIIRHGITSSVVESSS